MTSRSDRGVLAFVGEASDMMGRCQITRWIYSADVGRRANPYPGIDALREALTRPSGNARTGTAAGRDRLVDEHDDN
ncbi:hypothetical protein [Streptomyces sp. NPDC059460]|uniref:hypothetical protein n=1 Tax=Streptomyces sp. NPDC059460 TaxID=3346840 RepID=UPI00367AC2F2